MTPDELLNLSLQYEIDIECTGTIPPINLLTFQFPGCSPLRTLKIPLYLALHLRSLNLCTIVRPHYLSKEFIEAALQKEKSEISFVEMPEFIFEHSILFQDNETEPLLCELKCIRLNKIWKGLSSLDGKALYISGLSKWEFNEFKRIIQGSMKLGREISEGV